MAPTGRPRQPLAHWSCARRCARCSACRTRRSHRLGEATGSAHAHVRARRRSTGGYVRGVRARRRPPYRCTPAGGSRSHPRYRGHVATWDLVSPRLGANLPAPCLDVDARRRDDPAATQQLGAVAARTLHEVVEDPPEPVLVPRTHRQPHTTPAGRPGDLGAVERRSNDSS